MGQGHVSCRGCCLLTRFCPELQLRVSQPVTSTDLASAEAEAEIYKQLRWSASQQTRPCTQVRTGWGVSCTPRPAALHGLPPDRAGALASTGALHRKDHLGIFRSGNLRTLGCDWLPGPHDNLGRKCSCVLSPSVSLEGSWGVFGGLGRPLFFNIPGKQRTGEKAQYLRSLHPCMAFRLLDVPSFAPIWMCEDSWLRNKLHVEGVTN